MNQTLARLLGYSLALPEIALTFLALPLSLIPGPKMKPRPHVPPVSGGIPRWRYEIELPDGSKQIRTTIHTNKPLADAVCRPEPHGGKGYQVMVIYELDNLPNEWRPNLENHHFIRPAKFIERVT